MSQWGDIVACVLEENNTIRWESEGDNARWLFQAGWRMVKAFWEERARPLTIELSFRGRNPGGESTVLVVRTEASKVVYRRCACPTCGWDDAKAANRELVMTDELGLMFDSPIEWLTADGSRTQTAVWRDVQCAMCTELDRAGLDRVTKRPIEAPI